ncbi:protease [Streptomyces phytohabitans]|uniref:protease n=1 Tax=Streptomyces phytohabitans TaxID=1150371 RepID=UPI00345B6EFC
MTKFLLAVHVLAAILAIGPVAVAASMFPAAVRRAAATSAPEDGPGDGPDPGALAVVRVLHRICRVYAGVGVVVPVFGLATANSLGVLGDAWLVTSIVLTACAAGVLVVLVLPGQEDALAGLAGDTGTGTATAAGVNAGTGTGGEAAVRTEPAAVARTAARLGMYTGVFNLLWSVVTVLMIVRPGSTTGA